MTLDLVIPSYTQVQYLPDAIESALDQSTPLNRIFVIDDGSTDGSLVVARGYEPRVKVISQVNKGLSSARNTGIMNSTADYVLFLDADDVLLSNCVKRIAETIKETNADVVAPSFKCFGLSNKEIILMPNPKIDDFKVGNRIGYCAAVKKEALLEIGGYSSKMVQGYEDLHLWFNLLSRGKSIVTIPEVLWLYRTKENSMIHDAQKHHNELMAQIKKDFNV